MEQPTPKAIKDATGISSSYASMILSRDKGRTPPRPLAIAIFRATGWRHPSIAELTDEQMALLEQIEPWTPPEERAAA